MEGITIREPEQICQDCARKLLAVIRGPKLRAVLGYFVREVWAMPQIADLRLTSEDRVVDRPPAADVAAELGVGVQIVYDANYRVRRKIRLELEVLFD